MQPVVQKSRLDHKQEQSLSRIIEVSDDIHLTVQKLETESDKVLTRPSNGYVNCRETLSVILGCPNETIRDLGTLPQNQIGLRLIALRYLIANSKIWETQFNWRDPLRATLLLTYRSENISETKMLQKVEAQILEIEALFQKVRDFGEQAELSLDKSLKSFVEGFFSKPEIFEAANSDELLSWLILFEKSKDIRELATEILKEKAHNLWSRNPLHLDLLYLSLLDLHRYPAHSVSAKELKYVIIADKGEMGVRATREAIALGKTPVVLYSIQDDSNSLQVRLARKNKGIGVGLEGSFRESYGNYNQITERVIKAFQERFGQTWRSKLSRAALYPGYGPLAENSAAIGWFRRNHIVFVGPMQDVVEKAGDKRKFRKVVETLDPLAVTPGIIIDSNNSSEILQTVEKGLKEEKFSLPGRIKAANGGGGRGQAIVYTRDDLKSAIQKVLSEIQSYGWEPGVMFEQNIANTTHLEVQILRDRFGNTRSFGMRDCTEQRASQKIQEESPPAILKNTPELQETIEKLAVAIADQVGYVGAGTVELMYKNGKYYFLEMNTRIQVEHPVTELSYGIKRNGKVEALNLVKWQLQLVDGKPIDFKQSDVVKVAVAREFRINAESWNPAIKDSRDGKLGLFVPNAGRFDTIHIPSGKDILNKIMKKNKALYSQVSGLEVRFDCGFEKGDVLVNKDPTFGKLIISVNALNPSEEYEVLRRVCIETLAEVKIEGKQVLPDGKALPKNEFKTNVSDHIRILKNEMMRNHSNGDSSNRHVNWVIDAFRS